MIGNLIQDARSGGGAARYAGLAAVVTAAILWGLGGTVAGVLFEDGAAPLEVVALRTWISLAGLVLILTWHRLRTGARPRPGRVRAAWVPIVGFGLSVTVANAALFLAISRLPVAVALVLQNLAPAFVIAWGVLATRRLPAVRTLLGLTVALVCVAFVVELPSASLHQIDVAGVGLGLLTAAAVAGFSAFGGRAVAACGALTANTWAFAISGMIWLGHQLPGGVPGPVHHPGQLLGTLAVGIFGTLVPFLLFSWGTSRVGAEVGAVNISLEPLFGALLALVWLEQTLTLTQVGAAAILLAAIIDLQRTPPPAAGRTPVSATAPASSPALSTPGDGEKPVISTAAGRSGHAAGSARPAQPI